MATNVNYQRSAQALLLELNASLTRGGLLPSEAKLVTLNTHYDAVADLYEPAERLRVLHAHMLREIDAEGSSLMVDPVQNKERLLALQTAKNALLALQLTERVLP